MPLSEGARGAAARYTHGLPVLLLLLVLSLLPLPTRGAVLPEGFVHLDEIAPDIAQDVRYHGKNNFVGARVDGYLAPRIIITRAAAEALIQVQAELRSKGLGLLVLDAYRPKRAVAHFMRWAQDPSDLKTKARHYPNVPKSELVARGYIASRSSHSRGSAVDLTIISLADGRELDMGGGFDLFDPVSWPKSPDIGQEQSGNRMLLRDVMVRHGFRPYKREWWHFNFKNEPFPHTWFDFPVE